jgi:regulator of protease activity HflC (stomatin/prohibitin superfamily)
MSTALRVDTRITTVRVTDDSITADLADGRTISVPLAWSWRLSDATPEQRANWRLVGSGQGIHWPDVDEDIGVRGMLDGVPARRSSFAS